MKLIIDIPESVYEHIREYYEKNDIVESTYSYIYHGTPIPDSDLNEAVRIAYKQGRKDALEVLEQIRTEIQENINYNKKMNYQGIVAGLLLTLDIIDKYKGE